MRWLSQDGERADFFNTPSDASFYKDIEKTSFWPFPSRWTVPLKKLPIPNVATQPEANAIVIKKKYDLYDFGALRQKNTMEQCNLLWF
jgi:hypothetical protein